MAREDYRQYMLTHYWGGSMLNRLMLPAIGLILFTWALMGIGIMNFTGRVALSGIGFGLLIVAVIQNRMVTSSVESFGESPLAFQCRFFEDGFEAYENHSFARRPYSDIARIVLSEGAIYLYLIPIGLHILTREALLNRAAELADFLESKTEKKAARLGTERTK